MKKKVISVTEAARNFAECVNLVHYQNVTFTLLKNGLPGAQIVPNDERVCTDRQLAEALGDVELSPATAKAWRGDLRRAKKILKAPADQWQ